MLRLCLRRSSVLPPARDLLLLTVIVGKRGQAPDEGAAVVGQDDNQVGAARGEHEAGVVDYRPPVAALVRQRPCDSPC